MSPVAAGSPPAVAHRAEALVDHGAIAHNVALLARLAARAAVMVVVKADGYGHGAVAVARTALAAGADRLGVCTLDEAAELRAAGVDAPVLAWLAAPGDDRGPAVASAVDLGVSSRADLDAAAAGARRAGRPARIHLKIDTGLSRNGCPPHEWGDLLAAVSAAVATGDVEPVAVWTHLAHADAPAHPTVDRQAARFDDAHRAAVTHLGRGLEAHLANSAATLTRPDLHRDVVRPGIAVYGLDPTEAPDNSGLRPAMTFRSQAVLVKRVAAGEGVSYGHEWTTPDDRWLALVPVGYADGVPRRLGGRMTVRIGGARRPVVGRVCMDQVVVDLGPASDGPTGVAPGDEVVLFGPGDAGEPTAADWAGWLDTIHYEVVTGVGSRPRVARVAWAGAAR